jgi:hypothetical protein
MENIMKKKIRLLSILLGIGAIVMFVLASVLNLSFGWTIGLVMLIIAGVVALVFAFIEGNEGNDIGSYRMPRT